MLGMSWINSVSQFLVETSSSGGKDGRSHLYKNVPVPDQGYDVSTLYPGLNWGVVS